MKEQQPNLLGCGCATLVEAAVPTGPFDIALLERYVYNVDTYTPAHLAMLATEEATRCFLLGATIYFSLEQQNITPALAGGVIYLVTGVHEVFQSARLLIAHHQSKRR